MRSIVEELTAPESKQVWLEDIITFPVEVDLRPLEKGLTFKMAGEGGELQAEGEGGWEKISRWKHEKGVW